MSRDNLHSACIRRCYRQHAEGSLQRIARDGVEARPDSVRGSLRALVRPSAAFNGVSASLLLFGDLLVILLLLLLLLLMASRLPRGLDIGIGRKERLALAQRLECPHARPRRLKRRLRERERRVEGRREEVETRITPICAVRLPRSTRTALLGHGVGAPPTR